MHSRICASPARTHDRTESDFPVWGKPKGRNTPPILQFFQREFGAPALLRPWFATPPLVCSALLGLLCAPWFAKPPSFATPTLGACVLFGLPHLPLFGAIPRRMQLPLPTRICLHLSLSADRNGPAESYGTPPPSSYMPPVSAAHFSHFIASYRS